MDTQTKQTHGQKNHHKQGHHNTHRHKPQSAEKDKNQTKPNTTNNNNNNNTNPTQKTGTALNEFLCKFRYFNTLPELPFDAKLLAYPFDELRFAKYTTTSLEKNYKFQMHTEADLGITIDLIDPLAYKTPNTAIPLDEADSKLIVSLDTVEEANGASSSSSSGKRARPAVFWLYKTKYIASSSGLPKRHAGTEAKLPFLKNIQLLNKEDMTKDNQIRAIQATFESSKQAPVHPTQPNLKPVEVLPVLPDFRLWPNTYTQVVFDSDPVGHLSSGSMNNNNNKTSSDIAELRNEAILKGFTSEGRNMNVVAYLLPKKRKRSNEDDLFNDDDEGVEYEWIREYTYEVKTGQEFADTYFFVMSDNNVTYDEIRNRVALSKVKTKDSNFAQPSKITCVTREMTEEEKDLRENKTNDILQPELAASFDDNQDSDALVDDQEDNAWAVDDESQK